MYLISKKVKYIFIVLILSALIHSVYNTLFIAPIVLLLILVFYSKMIQSLLNISPYYDKTRENTINKANDFLFFLIIVVLVLSFLFDLFLNGFNSILTDPKSYIYLLIVPFFIYKIFSSKLVLNKGQFIILGKRSNSTGIKREMQDIIIQYYKTKKWSSL